MYEDGEYYDTTVVNGFFFCRYQGNICVCRFSYIV